MNKYFAFIKYRKKCKLINTQIKSFNIGSNVEIGSNCLISKRVVLNDNIIIGNFTYLNANKYWITVESNVKIGSFCSIAPGVHIGAGNHDYSFVTTHPILFDKYYLKKLLGVSQRVSGLKDKNTETVIGNDVWIGLNAIIKRGVKIGNGAVIAAGSVVVNDVPDYSIVGGNPARVIKYRTSNHNIDIMVNNEKNMFWNWDEQTIIKNFDKLYDFDEYVKTFIS